MTLVCLAAFSFKCMLLFCSYVLINVCMMIDTYGLVLELCFCYSLFKGKNIQITLNVFHTLPYLSAQQVQHYLHLSFLFSTEIRGEAFSLKNDSNNPQMLILCPRSEITVLQNSMHYSRGHHHTMGIYLFSSNLTTWPMCFRLWMEMKPAK